MWPEGAGDWGRPGGGTQFLPLPSPTPAPCCTGRSWRRGTPRVGVELCPPPAWSLHFGLLLSPSWHDCSSRPRLCSRSLFPTHPQPPRTGAGPFPASIAGKGLGRASAPSHPWPRPWLPRPAGPLPPPINAVSVSLQPLTISDQLCTPVQHACSHPGPQKHCHPILSITPPSRGHPAALLGCPPPAMEAAPGP